MRIKNICLTVWCTVLALIMAGPAHASGSGGFRVETPDAGAFGKGTSFVGEADTPAAVYYNPAGISQIDGTAVSLGFSAIQPRAGYENSAGDKQSMRMETFFIPHFHAVSDFGLDRWTFGVGADSNWGLTTDWAPDGFSRYVNTRTELALMDSYFVGAYEVLDQLTLAGSLDVSRAKASLEKKLFQGPGISDANTQIKGDDTVLGYRIAGHYRLNERHSFGLMYRSQNKLKLEGTLHLNSLQTSGTISGIFGQDYETIFGGSNFSTPARAEIVLPQSVAFGYSYRPDRKWTLNFDVEWFDWSSTEQLLFEYPDVTHPLQQAVLAVGNPASKDWDDAMSASFGVEYAWNDDLRLRAGYYFHQQVIPEASWDPSIPDADSHGVTLGLGYDFSPNTTMDLAYSFLYYDFKSNTNSNVSDGLGMTDLDGKYDQYINMALATVTVKFDEIFDRYAYRGRR